MKQLKLIFHLDVYFLGRRDVQKTIYDGLVLMYSENEKQVNKFTEKHSGNYIMLILYTCH